MVAAVGRGILFYARSLLTDPVSFPQSLTAPLLVWENPRMVVTDGPIPTTSSGRPQSGPKGERRSSSS